MIIFTYASPGFPRPASVARCDVSTMLHIQTILVPVDFSECSRRAAAHAMHVARRHDADVHVLHVVQRRQPVAPHRAMSSPFAGDAQVAAELGFAVVDDPEAPGAETPTPKLIPVQLYAPSVGDAVLDYARTHDVDLIVAGNPMRRGLRWLLQRSTAETILRGTQCSMMIVHAERASTPGQGIQRLLAAVDLGPASADLVAHARQLAFTYGAELDLLYVLKQPRLASLFSMDRFRAAVPEIAGYAREALHDLVRDTDGPDVPVQYHVLVGQPGRDIIRFIEAQGTDFAVVASHARNDLRHPLGGVTRQVVREAPCLVAVLKQNGRSLTAAPSPAATNTARHLDAVQRMYMHARSG